MPEIPPTPHSSSVIQPQPLQKYNKPAFKQISISSKKTTSAFGEQDYHYSMKMEKKNSKLNLSIKPRVTSSNAVHWFKTQTFDSSAHIKEEGSHGMMKGKAWTQQQNTAIGDDTTAISGQSRSQVQTWGTHILHPSPPARRNGMIQYYSSDILHNNTENWDISAVCFQEKQHTECVSLSFKQPVCCSTYYMRKCQKEGKT